MGKRAKRASERKEEILETAQALFYSKGYDATTIEDIINRIGIAKGTFYHYFKSKEDLLSQLANYQMDTVLTGLKASLEDFEGNALEKFRFVISSIGQWKFERKDLMIAYLDVLFSDKNIALRSKISESYQKIVPLYGEIIAEGQEEGLFDVDDAKNAAEIFIAMSQGFGEVLAPQILDLPKKPEMVEALIKKYLAFEKALERLLGLKEGTLQIFDIEKGREFFDYYIRQANKQGGGGAE